MADQTEEKARSLAGDRPRRAGERQPGTMRRIGHFHAVVTAPVTAQIVDVNRLRLDLEQCTAELERARGFVAQLEEQRRQFETKLAQFEAAPIERLDDDPDVPLEAPKPVDAGPAGPGGKRLSPISKP